MAPGTPISTSQLLHYGTRAAVDQALSRLVKSGFLRRATHGIYYRPKISRLVGSVPPETQEVVRVFAESRGESIAMHGAEAARQFGLSTQTPLSPVFLTSGRSRILGIGKQAVRLQHVSSKALVLAGQPAGAALSALRYLGPKNVTYQVITQVRSALPDSEFARLRAETAAMPSWLSDAFYRYERSEECSPSESRKVA